jgi:hypothetical protein
MRDPIRRVGSSPKDTPPEAQYRDEFYRALHVATAGGISISPEFASTKGATKLGRIDFFVPHTKWGIEITRNGNKLDGHDSRFKENGAYGTWLATEDMVDYILLDFWKTCPHKPHPSRSYSTVHDKSLTLY